MASKPKQPPGDPITLSNMRALLRLEMLTAERP